MCPTQTSSHHSEPSIPWQLGVYLALMLLLAATLAANHLPLGRLALLIALAIASAKAILVILYFMHVRFSSKVTRIFVIAGFLWLTIFFSLTFNDYLTRGWLSRTDPITARQSPIPPPPSIQPHAAPDSLRLQQQPYSQQR